MRTQTLRDITWHDLPKIEEGDLKNLQTRYGFHELDVEDCLSEHERPKIEEYDTYIFLVFHIPWMVKGRIIKEEVNIFLGEDFLVTIHEGSIPVFQTLWEYVQANKETEEELLGKGTGFFLYEIIERLFDEGFPIVDRIRKELRSIEEDLFENDEDVDVLRDIMSLKRNIITMRSILLPQRSLIALLEHKNKKFIPEELGLYFDDVLDAIERQWALLDTAKEMSEALQDTHESWLTHQTNLVVRTLTIMSVTLLPATLLTGLFGMNVPLPLQDHPYSIFGIILLMVTIIGGTLGYFKWKKWL